MGREIPRLAAHPSASRLRDPPSRRPVEHVAFAVVVAIGLALRTRQYLANASFFDDEAHLALNVISRGVGGLLHGLDHHQAAPPLFLMIARLSYLTLGGSELSLRLAPFAASVVAILGFSLLARRLLPSATALLATAMFAWCPVLNVYGATFKQYSSDVTVGIVILLAVSARSTWFLVLAGVCAPWASHPAVILLFGCAIPLLHPRTLRQPREAGRSALVLGTWALSALALYLVQMRHLAADDFFHRFWQSGAVGFPPRDASPWAWYPQHLADFFTVDVGVPAAAGAACLLLGVVRRARARDAMTAPLALPLVLTLLLAAARAYPLYERFQLFLVPGIILLMAEGVRAVGLLRRRWMAALAGGALVAILIAPAGAIGVDRWLHPPARSGVRQLVAIIAGQHQPHDVIYAGYKVAGTFQWYARGQPWATPSDLDDPSNRRRLRHGLRTGRAWILFANPTSGANKQEHDHVIAQADELAQKRGRWSRVNSVLYLYQGGATGPPPGETLR